MKEETNHVTLLKNAFGERCARNSNYSLRSFANSLGVSHSLLSLIINGKRQPSNLFCKKIEDNFGIQTSYSKHRAGASSAYKEIELESFEQIASWIHYAILGLLHLPGFRAGPKWLSLQLGVSPSETAIAWEQLLNSGHVTKQNGVWRQSSPNITVKNNRSTATTRKFTKDILKRAELALESEPFNAREFGSISFAMRQEDVAYAREKLKSFRRELCAELEGRGPPDRVYALTHELFPLSKKTENQSPI
jgi:uncharacterized protein (TIGR02147 family)